MLSWRGSEQSSAVFLGQLKLIPFFQFSVIDPLEKLPLDEKTINEFILDDEASPEDPRGNMTECIRRDPFQTLPAELIHRTMDFLEGHDIFAFREASPFARDATSNSTFWKSLLRREQKWLWGSFFGLDFWESRSLTQTRSVDWEKLYVVLEEATAKTFGIKGDLMGLANRRRIWRTCEEIAEAYWSFWPQRLDLREADRLAEPAPVPVPLDH